MEASTVMLVIMGVVIVTLFSSKLSVSLTLLVACCVMILTGILTFQDAFAQLGSTTVWLLISLGVVGEAVIKSGLMDTLGRALHKMLGRDEKKLIIALYLISAATSFFINGLVIVIVFMSVVDKMVLEGDGVVTRKHTYYPIALGAGLGSLCSSIGSSSMMNVSAQLAASSYGRPFDLLAPFPVGIVVTLTGLVIYMTFGYPLQQKVFRWPDIPPEITQDTAAGSGTHKKRYSARQRAIILLVLVGMILAIALGVLNTGVISLLGLLILILTGCMTEKEAWRAVDWQTVMLVVGALAFGKGISDSGAGQRIANFVLGLCGPLRGSAYGMCVVCLVVCMLLSNFMANNSAAAIMTPIALNLAMEMGTDMLPFAIACGIGVNLAIATPVCRTLVTITMPAGYTFKTMGIVGGTIQIMITVAAAVTLLLYF